MNEDDTNDVIVEYAYGLVAADGHKTDEIISSIEDYFTKVVYNYFCVFNETNLLKQGISTKVGFSAEPPDLQTTESCQMSDGQSECTMVDGGLIFLQGFVVAPRIAEQVADLQFPGRLRVEFADAP